MSVVVTEGDAAWAVFISPWTIQGWRPLSVSSQPAVFIRNGAITNHGAISRNHLAFSSFLRRISHRPHRRKQRRSMAAR